MNAVYLSGAELPCAITGSDTFPPHVRNICCRLTSVKVHVTKHLSDQLKYTLRKCD